MGQDVPRNFTVVSGDAVTGSEPLVKTGAGSLSLIGAEGHTFDGDIRVDVDSGTLSIGGALGAVGVVAQGVSFPNMVSTNTLTVLRGGTFLINDNAVGSIAGYIADRLGSEGNRPKVRLAGGALTLFGVNNAAATSQTFGDLTLEAGPSVMTVTRTTAGTPRFIFSSLIPTSGSYVTFAGTALGAGTADGRILFITDPPSVGGGGASGTTTMNIIPRSRVGNDLATYGAYGVRALLAAEYNSVANHDINGAGATENVRIANTTPTTLPALTAPRTVNALLLFGAGNYAWAMGDTLTLTSGQLLSTPNNTRNISSGVLTAGAGSAIDLDVTIIANTTTIGANIADNGAGAVTLVKNGVGALTLATATDNTYSGGTFVNEGTLTVNAGTDRRYLGTGPVVVNNALLALNAVGATANGVGDDYTVVNGGQVTIGTVAFTADDTFNIGAGSVLAGAAGTGTGLNSLDRGVGSATTNVTLAADSVIAHVTPLTAALDLDTRTVKNLGTAADLYYGLGANQASAAGSITIGSGTAFKGISVGRAAVTWLLGTIEVATGTSDIYLQGLAIPGAVPVALTLGNALTANGPVVNLADAGTLSVQVLGPVAITDDAAVFGDSTAGKHVKFVVNPGATLTVVQPGGLGSGAGVATVEVLAGGTLMVGHAAALNGDVTVKAGGRLVANQAGGLTGSGVLTFEDGAIIEVISAATGFSGAQADTATLSPGTIVRMAIANVGSPIDPLDFRLAAKAPIYEVFNGAFWPINPGVADTTIMTLDADAGTGRGGMLVNDGLSRAIAAVPNGVIVIGTNGGTIAATTNTILTVPQAVQLGTNTLTIGATNRLDGQWLPKLGTVHLNAINGYNTALPGGRIQIVPGATLGNGAVLNALPEGADIVADGTLLLGAAQTIGSLSGSGRVNLLAQALTVGRNHSSTTYSGELSGNGPFIKSGMGRLDLTAGLTNNGLFTVNRGVLAISGNGQTTNTGVTAYTVIGDGTLVLDNSSVNMDNRLAGALPGITFQGGTFRFVGKNGEASSEALGAAAFASGASTIDMVNGVGAGSSAQVTFSAQSAPAGTVNFTASNGTLGQAGDNPRVFFTGLATGLVYYATVGNAPAYYETANGIRAFAVTEGVEFDGTVAQTGLNTVFTINNTQPTLTLARAVGSLWIDSPGIDKFVDLGAAGTYNLTLSLGRLLVTGTNDFEITRSGTSAGTLTRASNGALFLGVDDPNATLTMSVPIANGSGIVQKDGAGTLVLNAANTFTGALTINDGTVRYAAGGAGDLNGNAVNIWNGATLDMAGDTDSFGITTIFQGGITNSGDGGVLTVSTLTLGSGPAGSTAKVDTGSGWLVLNGTVTYNVVNDPDSAVIAGKMHINGTRTFAVNNSVGAGATIDLDVPAAITGAVSQGITKTGVGTMRLGGANTFDGPVLVTGTLELNHPDALGLPSTTRALTVYAASSLVFDGGNGNIAVPANYSTVSLNGTGNTLYGPISGALINQAGNNTVPGAITLAATGTQIASLKSGDKLTLTGNISGNAMGLVVAGRGDTELGGVLGTTTGTLIKNNGGTLTLSGGNANTYSGATTVNAGKVVLNKSAGRAIVSGLVTVNNGGVLEYAAASENTDLIGTAAVTINGTGQLDFNGATDTIGNMLVVGTGATADSTPVTNTAGGGGLTIGTLGITPVPGYVSRLDSGSGTLTLGGNLTQTAVTTGRAQIGGNLDLGAVSRTLTINAGTGPDYDMMIDAVISGGAGVNLTRLLGRLLLTAANTYVGDTILTSGTTLYGHVDAIPSGAGKGNVSGVAAGILDLNGFSPTINGLSGTGTVDNTASTAAVFTVGANDQDGIFRGVMRNTGAGTLAFTKTGTGTLLISGANTYAGDTTVATGTLQLGSATTLPRGAGKGNIHVDGLLNLGGFSPIINGLNGAGTIDNTLGAATYTLTVGDNDQDGVFNGVITNSSGTVALTKLGLGVQTLAGDSAHGGMTRVNAGTLLVGNTAGSATGSGPVQINAGGTLAGNGFISGAVSNLLRGTLMPGLPGEAGHVLTVGALSLVAGSTNVFEFAAGTNDYVAVAGGGLAAPGADFILVEAGTANPWTTDGVYTLVAFDGPFSGNLAALSVKNPAADKSYVFDVVYGEPSRLTVGVYETKTWTGASVVDGNWTTVDNWSGVAPVEDELLVFSGLGGNWLTNNLNDYPAGTRFGGLVFAAGASPFTLNGAALGLNGSLINNSLSVQTLALPLVLEAGPRSFQMASGTVYAAASISETNGAAQIVKSGAGLLTLAGSNSFSGGLALTAGTLNVNHHAALGVGTLTISGGILNNNSGAPVELTTDNPQEWLGNFAFLGTTNLNLGAGPVTLNQNVVLTVTANKLTVPGVISGTGRLTKSSSGYVPTLELGSANTFTGGFASTGGAVIAPTLADEGEPSSIGASGPVSLGGGPFVYTGPSTSCNRNLTLTASTLIEVLNPGTRLTLTGDIPVSASSLITMGPGTLELAGTNMWIGACQLSGGYTTLGRVTLGGGKTLVNGSIRGTAMSVFLGNTLGGTGSLDVSGNILFSNTTLAPGEDGQAGDVLTLNAATLTFTGATAIFEFDESANDTVVFTNGGNIVVNSLGVRLLEAGTTNAWRMNGEYRLVQYAGDLTGVDKITASGPAAGTEYMFYAEDGWLMVRVVGPDGKVWDGAGADDNWLTAGNWDPESAPDYLEGLTFAGTTRLTPYNNMTGLTNGGLWFADYPAAAGAFTLSGEPVFLAGAAGNVSATAQTIDLPLVLVMGNRTFMADGNSLTVSGAISDDGNTNGLIKAGPSPVILSGANTYGGLTLVTTGGVLNVRHASALGDPVIGTVVSNAAALELEGGITIADEPLTLFGTGVAANGALRNAAGSNVYAGPITLGSAARIQAEAGTLTLGGASPVAGNFALTLGGVGTTVVQTPLNTGTGTLTKDGSGMVVLGVPNGFTGLTTILDGTLASGCDDALATGAITINGSNAVWDIGGYSDTVGLINLTAGAITGTGILDIAGGFRSVNGAACPDVYCSAVLTGTGMVWKAGSGYRTHLTATNSTYTGRTEPAGGGIITVPRLANGGEPSSIGASTSDEWNLILHGQLEYTGPSVTIDRNMVVAPNCRILGFAGWTLQTDQDEGTIIVTQPDTTLTITGKLYNNTNAIAPVIPVGFFYKRGAGTLELSAENPLVGRVYVADGTLKVSGSLAATNYFWTTPWYPLVVASNATVSGTGSIGPAVQVNALGGIAPGKDGAVGSALTVGGLILAANSQASFWFNSDPTNDTVVLTGSDTLTIHGGLVSLFAEGTTNAWTTEGTYNLIRYDGVINGGGPGLLSVANPAPEKGYTFGVQDGWVTVTISGSSTWDGGGTDDNWLTGENWTTDTAPAADDLLVFTGDQRLTPQNNFTAGTRFSGFTFDELADAFTLSGNAVKLGGNIINASSNSQAISLAMELDGNDRLFSAVGADLLVSGAVSDGGNGWGIIKSGSGSLTLSGANTYGGNTVVSQGRLVSGAAEVIPNGAGKGLLYMAPGTLFDLAGNNETINGLAGVGTVSNSTGSATLTLGDSGISSTSTVRLADGGGTLNIVKTGGGILALANANAYSGTTVVSAGTLRIINTSGSATGSGDVEVQAGAVLDGTGSLRAGLVALAAGAYLEPGVDGTGILTVNDLRWSDGAVYRCEVTNVAGAAGVDYDSLVATGWVMPATSGDKLTIRLDSLGQSLAFPTTGTISLRLLTYGEGTVDLADYTLDTNSFLADAGPWTLTNMGQSIYAWYDGGETTNVWTGAGEWGNPGNWSKGTVPAAGDTVLFNGTSTADCLAGFGAVNDALASITLDAGYTGVVTLAKRAAAGGMTLFLSGDLAVKSGALALESDPAAVGTGTAEIPHGEGYTVRAASIRVETGASLNADNLGFAPFQGPAAGFYLTTSVGVRRGDKAPSHGGYGGMFGAYTDPLARYGNPVGPTSLGSGGEQAGGGALRLQAGTVTVNGVLSASCIAPLSVAPGGAGGSIWIDSGTLEGDGAIRANGSSTTIYSGGAGGRIDISGATNNFAGALEVLGGYGNFSTAGYTETRTMRRGTAGSILLPQSAGTALTLDNFVPYTNIVFGNALTFGNAEITNGITVKIQAYNEETVLTFDTLTVRSNGTIVCIGDLFAVNAAQGGTLTFPYGHGVILVASNIVIDAGGHVHADNEGFPSAKYTAVTTLPGYPGVGPGGAPTFNVTGASYGGQSGGNKATPAYSDITKRALRYGTVAAPTALGSSGNQHNYNGGGAIKLVVSGTMTVNGALSADATHGPGNNSASSGGSIWIASGTIAGNGRITANGGPASAGGAGGGGGRIDVSGTVNNFTGVLHAKGGGVLSTFSRGQAGSVLLPESAGSSGATMNNFVPYGTDFIFGNSLAFGDCVVGEGVVLTLDANEGDHVFSFQSLTIQSGGVVRCMGNLQSINEAAGGHSNDIFGLGVTLVVSNLTIEAGGSLNADGTGFDNSVLPAARSDLGAGYGGLAGAGAGRTYGTLTNVTALGNGNAVAGGGAIRLLVSGTMTVDGTVSADGLATGTANGASGGSLWIDCHTLTGGGVISAGGSGGPDKVGGGGGRVHVVCEALDTVNPFADDSVVAYGGGALAASKGAAGTVRLVNLGSTESDGWLLVVNDGPALNTTTPLTTNDSLAYDQVRIGTGGSLSLPDGQTLTVTTVFSNSADFVAGAGGLVELVGTNDAVVYGSTSFDSLRIADDVKTVRFEAGGTSTVSGSLTLDKATLMSTADGNWWFLRASRGSAQQVGVVSVKDSNASDGDTILVTTRASVNLGHNVNWVFRPTGALIIIR